MVDAYEIESQRRQTARLKSDIFAACSEKSISGDVGSPEADRGAIFEHEFALCCRQVAMLACRLLGFIEKRQIDRGCPPIEEVRWPSGFII